MENCLTQLEMELKAGRPGAGVCGGPHKEFVQTLIIVQVCPITLGPLETRTYAQVTINPKSLMQYFCYSHLISVVSLQSHHDCLILNRWCTHMQHFNQLETARFTDAGTGGRGEFWFSFDEAAHRETWQALTGYKWASSTFSVTTKNTRAALTCEVLVCIIHRRWKQPRGENVW